MEAKDDGGFANKTNNRTPVPSTRNNRVYILLHPGFCKNYKMEWAQNGTTTLSLEKGFYIVHIFVLHPFSIILILTKLYVESKVG